MGAGQRYVLVEQRLNENGSSVCAENKQRQHGGPGPQPPTAWTPADHGIQAPRENRSDGDRYRLLLGPIPKPGWPRLLRNPEVPGNQMANQIGCNLRYRGVR